MQRVMRAKERKRGQGSKAHQGVGLTLARARRGADCLSVPRDAGHVPALRSHPHHRQQHAPGMKEKHKVSSLMGAERGAKVNDTEKKETLYARG